MKLFFSVLLCTLISSSFLSQEKKDVEKDTLKKIQLDEVIVTGKFNTYYYF